MSARSKPGYPHLDSEKGSIYGGKNNRASEGAAGGTGVTEHDREWVKGCVAAHQKLVTRFFTDHEADVLRCAGILSEALQAGGKILLFGNGGSAADAQHLAAEFVGALGRDHDGLAAVALTTDSSVLTSLSNDFDYRSVFARQVRALGRGGDAAVGISTSGRSPNILEGLREARSLGLRTVAILGRDGGPAREWADAACIVPGEDTQRIQEVHLMIGHLLCEMVIDRCRPGRKS
jgi:D-sedoheptulose 7-phosphate isomerase